MSFRLDVHLETHPGQVRERNEDSGLVQQLGDDTWVLAVCDGMGGHADGQIASRTAAASLARDITHSAPDQAPYRILHDALRRAHQAVIKAAAGSNMGTTAVVARVVFDRCWYGWVGDSRFYLLRRGRVVERSEDHTAVRKLVESGVIRPEDAANHPSAGVLVQALGANLDDVNPTVFEEPIELRPDDVMLLCSDGLHDLVADEELPRLVAGRSASEAAKTLVALANARGGHDNITVVVARFVREARPDRHTRPDLDPAPAEEAVVSAPPVQSDTWNSEAEEPEEDPEPLESALGLDIPGDDTRAPPTMPGFIDDEEDAAPPPAPAAEPAPASSPEPPAPPAEPKAPAEVLVEERPPRSAIMILVGALVIGIAVLVALWMMWDSLGVPE